MKMLALVAMLFAVSTPVASAQGAASGRIDCVYDYRMITDHECRAYRAKVLKARSEDERAALHGELLALVDARALERGVAPDDWRGVQAIPEPAAGGASLQPADVAVMTAVLGYLVLIALYVAQSLWPVRRMRLMRCPETGTVAFVEARNVARGPAAGPTVRSCELWPKHKDCARGCLARYDRSATGLRVNIEALKPFERA